MELDALTDQQELFAQSVANGNNQTESYKIAYPKSLKWKPNSVYVEASEMTSNPKIARRIKELKNMIVNSNLWTKEESVKTLKNILTRTYQDESGKDVLSAQDKDAINAVKELNIMHGFNAPTKTELTGKDGTSLLPPELTINIAKKY